MSNLALSIDVELDEAVRSFVQKVGEASFLVLEEKEITYKKFLADKMLLVHSIRIGIPYNLYEMIKSRTPLNTEDWATFLGVSSRTLLRNKAKRDFVFEPLSSEKILELAEVSLLGTEVFDSEEQFYSWLRSPNFALDQMRPFDLLQDSYGKEMVMNELHKIDYGLFS